MLLSMMIVVILLGILWRTSISQAASYPEQDLPDAPDLELVSHFGGLAGKVMVKDNRVYMAQAAEFTIMDVTTPTNPYRIGWHLLPGNVTGFDVADGYAFVGWEQCGWDTCTGGVKILDILQPMSLKEVSSYELPGSAVDVTVVNDIYLYVLWKTFDPLQPSKTWGGLKILNIVNPIQPAEINSIDLSPAPNDIAIAGGYGYYIDNWSLTTYDLGDPTKPIQVDSIEFPGTRIIVSGSYAYVSGPFSILSLIVPNHPVLVGTLTFGGGLSFDAIDSIDNYAYVSEVGRMWNGEYSYGGMYVVDVSEPLTPTQAAYLKLPYGSEGIAVQDNIAYVSAVYNGLNIVDVSIPTAPKIIGQYKAPGEVDDVAISNGMAYSIADYYYPRASGLWVSNIAQSNNPHGVGYSEVFGSRRLAVEDNYAYVLTSYYANNHFNNYIRIVDVMSPTHPIRVSSYPLAIDRWAALVIEAQNHYVYVTQPPQVTIVDARDPTLPVLASIITATQEIMGIAVGGAYAYVSDNGLRIFDISDPIHPNGIGSYTLTDGSGRLTVWDRYAYVVGGNGLHIIDISNPYHPTEVGLLAGAWNVYELAAAGGYVFLAADYDGLIVIDATQPENPFITSSYSFGVLSHTLGVDMQAGYIYLANYRDGLYIFRYNPLVHTIFFPLITNEYGGSK